MFVTVSTARPPWVSGADADVTVGDVVVDGVADEIRGEPFDELRVPGRLRRFERRVEDETVVSTAPAAAAVIAARSTGSLVGEAALAARQREQRLDQPLLLLADGEHLLTVRAKRLERSRPGRRARPRAVRARA